MTKRTNYQIIDRERWSASLSNRYYETTRYEDNGIFGEEKRIIRDEYLSVHAKHRSNDSVSMINPHGGTQYGKVTDAGCAFNLDRSELDVIYMVLWDDAKVFRYVSEIFLKSNEELNEEYQYYTLEHLAPFETCKLIDGHNICEPFNNFYYNEHGQLFAIPHYLVGSMTNLTKAYLLELEFSTGYTLSTVKHGDMYKFKLQGTYNPSPSNFYTSHGSYATEFDAKCAAISWLHFVDK